MSQLIPVTQTILGDEKAWALFEVHEQSPGSRGFHRYQVIYVNRDGNLAEWRKDMGLSKNWRGINQFRIPSLWEHTVDELMDIANYLREGPRIDVKDLMQVNAYKPA